MISFPPDNCNFINYTRLLLKKQVLNNLEIKAGKIRLPELMTKMSGFEDGEEVVLVAENGKIEIRKIDIK